MASLSPDSVAMPREGTVAMLGTGLLVANLAALLEVTRQATGLQLPVGQQLAYLAYSSYANWAFGLLFAAVLASPLFGLMRRWVWTGWCLGAGFLFVFALVSPLFAGYSLGSRFIRAALLALVFLGVANWIGQRIPALTAPVTWIAANTVCLAAALLVIALGAPLPHGGAPSGVLLALPAAALAPTFALVCHGGAPRRLVAALASVPMAALLLWSLPFASAPSDEAEVRNVILFSVDTLRRDHLSTYGSSAPSTPHIDRLAQRGTVFENALTCIPRTYPAHTTMLSGLYPAHHGVGTNRTVISPDRLVTLPKILRARGYQTAGFIGGFTLERKIFRLNDSFQVYDDHLGSSGTLATLLQGQSVPRLIVRLLNAFGGLGYDLNRLDRPAEHVIAAATDWLEANHREPFFLLVHLFDPHIPYEPPPPFDTRYDPDYRGPVISDWYTLDTSQKEQVIADARQRQHLKALYKGEVAYVDGQVGEFLAALDRLRLWDSTLVIFTADHGESLTEHGYYFDHGGRLFDQIARIPLIVHWPGEFAHPPRAEGIAELVDLFPTVLELLGLDVPDNDGRSLLALLPGGNDGRSFAPAALLDNGARESQLALRTPRFKYIRTFPWWKRNYRFPDKEELYDLEADPGELRNVIDDAPEAAEQMRSSAQRYVDEWFENRTVERGPELDRQTLEQLRSLGYE